MAFKMVLESHGAVLKAAAPKPRAAAPQQGVPLGVSQELRSRGGGAAVGGSGGGGGGGAAVGIDMSGADQQAMQMYDYEEEVRTTQHYNPRMPMCLDPSILQLCTVSPPNTRGNNSWDNLVANATGGCYVLRSRAPLALVIGLWSLVFGSVGC